jgi:hypothetical protein
MSQQIDRTAGRAVSPVAAALACLLAALIASQPVFAQATSPFLTGATALESNILAWLTPIAIILVMVLGGMAMANRIAQVSSTYGKGEAQTLVENCGNSLVLRCSASEHGGTSQFASRLIGQREVVRISRSRSRRPTDFLSSVTESEHRQIEPAVMDSEIERLPDLAGFLKLASSPDWRRVTLRLPAHARGNGAETAAQAGASRRPGLAAEQMRPNSWNSDEASGRSADPAVFQDGWEHD